MQALSARPERRAAHLPQARRPGTAVHGEVRGGLHALPALSQGRPSSGTGTVGRTQGTRAYYAIQNVNLLNKLSQSVGAGSVLGPVSACRLVTRCSADEASVEPETSRAADAGAGARLLCCCDTDIYFCLLIPVGPPTAICINILRPKVRLRLSLFF